MRLRQRRGKRLQPLQRFLSRRAVHHEPLLIDILPGQGGDGFFLRQNVLRQRLKPGDIVIHPQAGDPDGGEQRQRYRQPDREGFTVAPGVQPALHHPSQGDRADRHAPAQPRMPEHYRQARGAQPCGGEHRHLTNAGEGGQHHEEIRHDGGQQRQQQRVTYFRQALPGRVFRAVHHPLREVVNRIVRRDADDAHAHHQRHQVQFTEQQQRHDRPRQRADGNGEQAQQQRTHGAKHRHNQQDHPEHRGDAKRGNILFSLLAGVIAVEHRPAREQLRLWILAFQRLLQRVKGGHQLVGLLHIKRRARQLAVQQIPVVPGRVFCHQPAVHQLHLLAVFRQCELRAAHQHQRIVLQLLAAHAGKGGVELGQDPLGLCLTAVLQAGAGGRIDQAIAVLPEEISPGLLPGGIQRTFYDTQRLAALQQG
ncbi:Uncharacterised protein [Enterobacter cloacae]|nr:Uncharacterised protein [Enterobacter cloacae]